MTYNSPEDFIEAIQTALNRGDFKKVQQLSLEAAEKYSDYPEIKKSAQMIAPIDKASDRDRQIDLQANRDWIKKNQNEYHNRWVALRDGQLLASGRNFDELVDRVGEIKGTGIFVTAIYASSSKELSATYNSPEEFISALDRVLNRSDFNAARELSFRAVERYPDSAEIKKYAYILAPPMILQGEEQSKDAKIYQEWLRENHFKYRNRWVALRQCELVADAKTEKELKELIGDRQGILMISIG